MTDGRAPLPPGPGVPGPADLPTPEQAPWDRRVNRTRVVFGSGTLERLGPLVREQGGQRVLLVTDPGLVRVGHCARAEASLSRQGLAVAVFDGVQENPTTDHVEAGVEAARRHRCDFIVGLGGGSSMDCAKGINFVFSNGGRMEDYHGLNKATGPMLPSVGVPTTAGTGSEAQAFALIARASDHGKMACGDEKARFLAVILDPDLLASVPRGVAGMAGMDAVAHAVESFVSRPAGDQARGFAGEAWRLLSAHLETLFADDNPAAAWPQVLWGAHLAGAAIDRAMLGAAHACANPLTARCGVAHGVAVGLMLPHVIRFNGSGEAAALYADLQRRAGHMEGTPETLALKVEALRRQCGLPASLPEAGVSHCDREALAAEAVEQWTAGFNPRPLCKADFVALFEAAC